MVHILLHIFSFFHTRLPDLLTMLMGAGRKKNISAQEALIPNDRICLDKFKRETNMGFCVYVRNGGSDVERLFFHSFIIIYYQFGLKFYLFQCRLEIPLQ